MRAYLGTTGTLGTRTEGITGIMLRNRTEVERGFNLSIPRPLHSMRGNKHPIWSKLRSISAKAVESTVVVGYKVT